MRGEGDRWREVQWDRVRPREVERHRNERKRKNKKERERESLERGLRPELGTWDTSNCKPTSTHSTAQTN